jgi:hypothetical protein
MAKKIEKLASKLGAEMVCLVPAYSVGAFGAAKLARLVQERLVPDQRERLDRSGLDRSKAR